MAAVLLANIAITVSELKKNPTLALNAGQGEAVAILNNNRPTHYVVPAALWEQISELLEDRALNQLCDARMSEPVQRVSLDEL